jgi:Rieske Fe-S protein
MSFLEDQSRRRFVKTFVFGTATAAFLGKPWRGSLLAEATPPLAGTNVGILQVKLSDYPPLQTEFGSIRLGFNPIASDSTMPLGFFYPVLINRGFGTSFYAMDSGCSHAGCVVPPFDPFEGAMVCPCHGSHYEIDGTVYPDQPASSSLTSYPLTFDDDDTLTIRVPFLGYSVTGAAVQHNTASRFQLGFPTFAGVEYEVRFRARFQHPWAVVPFSTSIEEPASQMSLIGNEQPAVVFVDRTTQAGFYSVAIKVLNLTEPA